MSTSAIKAVVIGFAFNAVLIATLVGLSETRPVIAQSPPVKAASFGPDAPPKSPPIVEVRLENLTPAAKATESISLKPGQLKAFASGEAVSWVLTPVSDDATEDGLASEEAAAGSVIFGFDVDSGKFSRFRVPADQGVLIVACNPESKGKYLLQKFQTVAGRAALVSKTYLVAGGKSSPKPNPDDGKVIPVPPGPYTGKLLMVIIEETDDAVQSRGSFFADKELQAYLKQRLVSRPRIADKDVVDGNGNVPTDLAPYLARAKGKKLPQVYLVGEGGKVIGEGEIPAGMTAAEFLAWVKKIGGN